MHRTSPREPIKTRGFTLIELSMVITVLLVLAAAIMPHLANQREALETREFLTELRRVAAYARDAAISRGSTVVLRYEDGGPTLILESLETQDQEAQQIKSWELPPRVTGDRFQSEGNSVTSSEWQVQFFSDGASDGGGILLSIDGIPLALNIDEHGAGRVGEDLTDPAEIRWQAGDLETRQ